MAEVWQLATTFPSVVYTVLVGVVIVYWGFVIAGALDLGEGSGDFDVGDAAAGAAKGALEGGVKGALEHSFSADHGGPDGLDGADGADGADGDGDGPDGGALAALLSALKLRQVPVTTVLSLMITFSWLMCVVAMQIVSRLSLGSGLGWIALFSAPILALPCTILVVQPLAKVFVKRAAPQRSDLIGKTCVVRTGKVTEVFGEGTLEDGGAGLVVRVRVDGGRALARGEHALIVDWDAEHEAFVVEPMAHLLPPPGDAAKKSV
jgi:hypothetical protein